MILDKNGNPIVTSPPKTGDIATRTLVEQLIAAHELIPNPSKTLKTIGKIIDAFDQTRNHPDVKAASLNFLSGIRSLTWDLSQSPTQGARTDWIKSVLTQIDIQSACASFVTAREYGYTVCEVLWRKDGATILPYAIVEKPRKWFKFDAENRLRLITQTDPMGLDVAKLYPRKFLVVQHEATYLNPYGTGILDVLYWYVMGLYSNFEWHLQMLEDDGRDHWIAYVNAEADQTYIDAVQTALTSLRRRGVCVLRQGVQAEQRENKGRKSSSDAYSAFEQMVVTKINKLYLGTDLSMQLNDVGARASSETGADIRGEALSAGKTLAENAMNQLIRWIIDVNTVPGSIDEQINFSLSKPAETSKEQAEIDKIYAEATGMAVTEQRLIRIGYEPGDFSPFTAVVPATATTFAAIESGYSPGSLTAMLAAVEAAKKKP